MASALLLDAGRMPTAPIRVVFATVDFTTITSYATGGHLDPDGVLTPVLTGLTYRSVAQAHNDGSETRYFQVNPANHQIVAYDDSLLATETTATDNMSGHTAIPIFCIGY